MKYLFMGWDVGAWNCDRGRSRDALCVLTGSSFEDLRFTGRPWRGNLRGRIVGGPCPDALLEEAGLVAEDGTEVVVAVDTPLGWPAAFSKLLAGDVQLAPVSDAVPDNPYIFRRAEQALVQRGLFSTGRTPLSPVRDMIGSQSTKGLYYLRNSAMIQTAPAVWQVGDWTAIETYPAPVRTSSMLRPHFDRLRSDSTLVARTREGRNAEADLHDALWCALVAASWTIARTRLVKPPEGGDIRSEGWIWLPSDCNAGSAETETP